MLELNIRLSLQIAIKGAKKGCRYIVNVSLQAVFEEANFFSASIGSVSTTAFHHTRDRLKM